MLGKDPHSNKHYWERLLWVQFSLIINRGMLHLLDRRFHAGPGG